MRDAETWGSRIEIMIFCKIYEREIFVAHATSNKTFELDSTLRAIKNIHSDSTMQVKGKRIGYIAIVNRKKPFSLDNELHKNHFFISKETWD